MVKITWKHLLRGVLDNEQRDIRPELINGLEEVLNHNQKDVNTFSAKNISRIASVYIREKDRTSLLPEAFSEDLIRPLFTAVYLANCNYFNTQPNFSQDEVTIQLPIADDKPATYCSRNGPNKHLITIPTWKFKSWPTVLFSMDAESRHAVHNNFLHQNNLPLEERANRAYLVISETIDEGQVYTGKLSSTPHYDPFINEVNLAKDETDGHNGARYFCKYFLKIDLVERRQQLNWLIRLKLREKFPENEVTGLLKKKLNEIMELAYNDGKQLKTPYAKNLNRLLDFYKETPITSDVDEIRAKLDETRTFLLRNFPFYPERLEIIYVDDRLVNKFATVLDYVALKLKYTPPTQLARESGL